MEIQEAINNYSSLSDEKKESMAVWSHDALVSSVSALQWYQVQYLIKHSQELIKEGIELIYDNHAKNLKDSFQSKVSIIESNTKKSNHQSWRKGFFLGISIGVISIIILSAIIN